MLQDAVTHYRLSSLRLEFFLNTCDHPMSFHSSHWPNRGGLPFMSTGFTADTIDIPVPDPLDLTGPTRLTSPLRGGLPFMSRGVTADTIDIPVPNLLDLTGPYNPDLSTQIPWEKKESRAVFRGKTTNYELLPAGNWGANPRIRLHLMSPAAPHLMDACINSWSKVEQPSFFLPSPNSTFISPQIPWEKKESRAVFRGKTTNYELLPAGNWGANPRIRLHLMSPAAPHLMDACINSWSKVEQPSFFLPSPNSTFISPQIPWEKKESRAVFRGKTTNYELLPAGNWGANPRIRLHLMSPAAPHLMDACINSWSKVEQPSFFLPSPNSTFISPQIPWEKKESRAVFRGKTTNYELLPAGNWGANPRIRLHLMSPAAPHLMDACINSWSKVEQPSFFLPSPNSTFISPQIPWEKKESRAVFRGKTTNYELLPAGNWGANPRIRLHLMSPAAPHLMDACINSWSKVEQPSFFLPSPNSTFISPQIPWEKKESRAVFRGKTTNYELLPAGNWGANPRIRLHLMSPAAPHLMDACINSWSKSRAVFRGKTTNYELLPGGNWGANPRIRLHLMSPAAPHLMDARINAWSKVEQHVIKRIVKDGVRLARKMNFQQFNAFKYQIVADGGGGSCRTCGVLRSNQLIIRQHTPMLQFYEPLLQDRVHWLATSRTPTRGDHMAQQHDKAVLRMVEAANRFAYHACTWHGRMLYWALLLVKYQDVMAEPESVSKPAQLCLKPIVAATGVEKDPASVSCSNPGREKQQPECAFFCAGGIIPPESFKWLPAESLDKLERVGPP
ncbi:unnamed protein product [Closterium sp. Naga37s-1]|nr:unnamed protein product [Closterium sp. Naga37s-1]